MSIWNPEDIIKSIWKFIGSKRRSHYGMDVAFWDAGGLGTIETFRPPKKNNPEKKIGEDLPDVILGDTELEIKQSMEMLRRSKMYLGMRKPDEELVKKLERRRDWNIANRPIENNLDLFTGVKYSYSSKRPDKDEISIIVSEGGRVRFDGVVRSGNMRLDPVDAVRIAYKRRNEIQRALTWGYDNGCIPVMMTFTIFHDWTWQPLEKLIAVLRKSYKDMFGHKIGGKLKDKIGFKYRIFRMEETIDMESKLPEHEGGSAHDGKHGWHPHYHVIVFVPKDNLEVLDKLEPDMKSRWQKFVKNNYNAIVGKEIPESYLPALYKHGFMISRYSEDVKDEFGNVTHSKGEIYQVDNTKYLDKIMGCDSAEMYGGDKEFTNSLNKSSVAPFDLLRMKPTAEIVDLWNEYAIATKGLSVFRFTPGFKGVIDEYFKQHPDRDPVSAQKPKELFVAPLKQEVYHLLYRNFKLAEIKRIIVDFVRKACFNVAKVYDFIFDWLKKLFVGWGLPEPLEEDLFVFPRPPN